MTDLQAPQPVPVTWQQACDAIDSLDDYASMMVGVDPSGPRELLYRFVEQMKKAAEEAEPMEMALCESQRLVLREGQLYRFRRVSNCETCATMSAASLEAYGQPPAIPAPEGGPAVFDANGFRAWVLANLPDDTIIGSGAYWADHLTAWAGRFVKPAPAPCAAEGDAPASSKPGEAPRVTRPDWAGKADNVMLPVIGAVPAAMASDEGIRLLRVLVESVSIVNGIACWNHMTMFDLRDYLCTIAASKAQPKGTEPPGWVGPELTPESMTDLAVAIGELSQAMGSPCVMGRAPQTLKSQTVRMAAFRLKEAQAPAPAPELTDEQIDALLPVAKLDLVTRGSISTGGGSYGREMKREPVWTQQQVRQAIRAVIAATAVRAPAVKAEPAWGWNPTVMSWEPVRAPGHWQRGALYAFGPSAPGPLAPSVPPGYVLVESPITEEMHQAACKVLARASGLDGTPQRMLDALAALGSKPPVQGSQS